MEPIFLITSGRSRFMASLPSRGLALTPLPPVMLSPMSILLSWGMCLRYSRSPLDVFSAIVSKSTSANRSAIFVPHCPTPIIKALKTLSPLEKYFDFIRSYCAVSIEILNAEHHVGTVQILDHRWVNDQVNCRENFLLGQEH